MAEQVRGGSSAPWRGGGQDQAGNVSDEHFEAAQIIDSLVEDLQAGWTGEGANSALARIGPFASVMRNAADALGQSGASLRQVADGFDNARTLTRDFVQVTVVIL